MKKNLISEKNVCGVSKWKVWILYVWRKKCDKIHFTDVCEQNENCKEKFCDKRHPVRCFFFEKLRMCKFGTFCSYIHIVSAEEQLKLGVEKLKKEILSL